MPQDGLKSTVYRSFITCDDPKGVVDCGIMMRRSKSSGGKEVMMAKQKKIEIRKQSKNSIRPSSSLELLISQDQEFPSSSSSSFQLMEVSRGAQRLNHMIDSWSNENKGFDDGNHGKSNKHIGTDLLRGALDLQESLVMLGKLQEASQYMSCLNKKNMGKVQRAYPDRYRDQESVKPRLSYDGYSSGTSNEELKKVIRDSLVRQNLFDDSGNPEKGCAYSPQRYREYSCSESTPSTSSSQSSMYQTSSEFSSISSQKAKGPGLIAKLMGIEEYPLKPLQENERISHQQRPAFEIDRPQVRKPQTSSTQSGDSDLRTLKEVLETLKFKGLLRNKSFEEPKFEFQHATHSESGKRFSSGSPPIVLIKPIAVESPEMESHVPVVRGDESFYNRRMIKKLRSLEDLTLTRVRTTEGALKSDKVQRKIEAEESPPIKKPIKAERPKSHKVSVEKHGEKEAKTKESALRKLKASQAVVHKPQKEAIDKRVDKIQKVAAVNKKSPEKDVMKAKHVLKSQDQANVTSSEARKPESGSNITKTRVTRQPSTVASTTTKNSTMQNVVSNSTERRRSLLRKEKPVKEPKSVTKNVVNEENVKMVDISEKSESSLMSSNTDDQLLDEQETGGYNIFQSCISEAAPQSSREVINTERAEEAPAYISQSRNDGKMFRSVENLGVFLLSNALFLSHAEEFFDFDVNDSTALQTSSISSSGLCSTSLILDCADELVECKRFQVSQTVNPLSLVFRDRQRVCISLEKLVKDVCNGIETLGSHSKLAGENILADSLNAMLERDVMCKGLGKGTWNLGWRHGFSGDEAEKVVNDIERLIFIGLIKEVFA